jgi:hypothetical protein
LVFALLWRHKRQSRAIPADGAAGTAYPQNYNNQPPPQGGPVAQVTTYYPPPMEAQQQYQPAPGYQPPSGGVTESYGGIKHEYQPAYSPPPQSPMGGGLSSPTSTSTMPLSPEMPANEIQPQGPLSGNWGQQAPQQHPAGMAEKE